MSLCPCGSRRDYSDCCAPLHQGQRLAENPEQLMRSRYCAYVKAEARYLLETHHPEFRGGLTESGLQQACKETQWRSLDILSAPAPKANQGEVEFKAWYQDGETTSALHERSRFSKVDGRWLYCDGEFNPKSKDISRNAPCPCGSGKKYKRCCAA